MISSRYQKKREFCRKVANFEKVQANPARVAKNTLVLYMRMLAVMFVGLFTSRVQLQALGKVDLGLYTVATGVVSMFIFCNGSLASASSRFLVVEMGKGTPGSLKRTFSTVFYVHLIIACIFVLILETAGVLFLETKLNIDPSRIGAVKWAYHCAVFTTFLGVTQVPYSAVVTAHERMGAFAYMTIYDVVVKLLIVYVLLVSPWDRLKLYSTLLALSSMTTILIYRIYCIRNFTEARIRCVFDRRLLRPIYSFAGVHVFTMASIALGSQGVLMLNQRYFGPTLVTAIAIAVNVKNHVQGFIGNFKAAANPQIIKLYAAKKYEDSKKLLTETIHFSVFLLLILGVPIWFYSTEALKIWLGSNMPELSPIFVKIVLVGAYFSLFDVSLYVILYAEGRIKENMWLNVTTSIVSFTTTFLLIHFTRNPLVSCIVAACIQVVLGMVNKPLLLHRIAGYTLHDFRRIFVPAFQALIICVCIAYGVKVVFSSELIWAIPACAVIVLLSSLAIYMFIASDTLQRQVEKFLRKLPSVGLFCIGGLGFLRNISSPVRKVFERMAG